MVRDDEVAADVTQETFVKGWRALGSLNDPAAFGGWIRTIALNQVRDWVRAQRPTSPLESDDRDQMQRQWADEAVGPAELLHSAQQQQQVRDAIQRLNDDQRLVIVMHHLEGKPVVDISRELNIPLGTVLSRLARGREALRRKLAPHVED
jgi:RNA polymerase sigma-70 factor (ECF subfamily)